MDASLIGYVFAIHLLSTGFMCGLIWFVQIVHYPLFKRVPESGFVAYEQAHTRLTGWVVLPVMLAELGTAVLLSFNPVEILPAGPARLNLAGLVLIWLSTFFLQVPLHQRLSKRFDARDHRHLVMTNWIRTVLWTLRFGALAGIQANCF